MADGVKARIAGVWRDLTPSIRVAGAWKTPDSVHIRVGGIWKQVWVDYVAPLVSAEALGYTYFDDQASVTVGIQFNIDGNEYRNNGVGGFTLNRGVWLDAGSPSDVWVEFIRTSGSAASWSGKANSTRYNIATNQSFSITDTNPAAGGQSITGYFRFWDAATGGNILQTTASQTWTATYFSGGGCPTCCFTPETLITMASDQKPIGELKVGDLIETPRGPEKVTGIITRENRVMYRLSFNDGSYIDASDDHPFDVEGKGPASLNNYGTEYKNLGLPAQLQVGDVITGRNGSRVLVGIRMLDYPGTVYTLENESFYANGLLVY